MSRNEISEWSACYCPTVYRMFALINWLSLAEQCVVGYWLVDEQGPTKVSALTAGRQEGRSGLSRRFA